MCWLHDSRMFFEYFPSVLLWAGSLLMFAGAKARMKMGAPWPAAHAAALCILCSVPHSRGPCILYADNPVQTSFSRSHWSTPWLPLGPLGVHNRHTAHLWEGGSGEKFIKGPRRGLGIISTENSRVPGTQSLIWKALLVPGPP